MSNISASLVAVFIMFSVIVNAQNLFQQSIFKNGQKITRTMTIPEGWETSYSLKSVQKSEESFIKSSQMWHTAEGGFFINHLSMENESVDELIDFDMHNYTEFSDDAVVIKNGKTLIVDNNKSIAIVKLITGAADAPFQAVAYVPEKNTATVVTFFAENEDFFNENMGAFESFVKSYVFSVEEMPIVSIPTFY